MQTITAHNTNSTQKALIITATLFVLALIVGLSAYTGLLKPVSEPADTWFKRSGALILCLSYFAGMSYYNTSRQLLNGNMETSEESKSYLLLSRALTITLIVMGVTIFGFGDLIYQFTH
jgi:hypothetical protein